MPRNYQRKRTKTWTIMDVKNAVNEYNISNISCTTLATKYGIPAATLRRYIKRKIEDYPVNGGRFRKIFSHEQLLQLKNYLTEIDNQSHFGLKKVQCQKLVYDFAVDNNIPHRFSNITKLAGRDWMNSFMKNYGFSLRRRKTTPIVKISTLCLSNEESKRKMKENIILHRRKVLCFLKNVCDTDFKPKIKSDQNELLELDMFIQNNKEEPFPGIIKVKEKFCVKEENNTFDDCESDNSWNNVYQTTNIANDKELKRDWSEEINF